MRVSGSPVAILPAGETARRALRQRLEARRAELLRLDTAQAGELATPASDRGEDTTPSQHPADVASELERREFILTLHVLDARELGDVEAAIRRMDAGTYGLCVDCGRPIAAERLEALPHAARDVDCERARVRRRGPPAV
jgi:RNA polymerase-binding transcription factor DksA